MEISKMRKLLLVLLLFLFCQGAGAEDKTACPHCGFLNYQEDRYCLDCAQEMRAITQDEKVVLADADKKREEILQADPKKDKSCKVEIISYDGKAVDLADYLIEGSVMIFDFYADWCGPCKSLAPKLESLVNNNPNVYLRKINIKNWNTPVVQKYQINSIPSIWIYNKQGKLVASRINGMSNIETIVQKIR